MIGAEMKQRNIDTMGETLGRQYTALFQEFASLNLYWKEFLELFGTNDKRIARMNQSAPGFFQMLQEQQFETNMSHLARLTDSSKSIARITSRSATCPIWSLIPVSKPSWTNMSRISSKRPNFAETGATGASLIMTCCWQPKTAERSRLNPPPRKR